MLEKRIAVEANIIPQIYDEEAAVASAESSTSGQFLFFREVRNEYRERLNLSSKSTTIAAVPNKRNGNDSGSTAIISGKNKERHQRKMRILRPKKDRKCSTGCNNCATPTAGFMSKKSKNVHFNLNMLWRP
ncbi:hypothetical protein T12_1207 [Trichinella patagoniensis]|uniref:Uncharacterized protein n=1 Tax=Trichinella patagoniensis TaxID=990121 RepID=A0A0V0ZU99_9BILA|nr:hypothetical protein T12_1207 [Trichinella patagoniensis]